MKKLRKAILTAVLGLLAIIPFSLSNVSAAAATNIGSPVESLTSKGWGNYYKYNYTDGSGKQVLFYGDYKPTASSNYEFVVHNKNGALATVANIAADYTAKTGKAVKMAVNGDFFQTASGVSSPIDSMVVNGEVKYQGAFTNKNAFGFDNNGNFAIGRMTTVKDVLRVTVGTKTYQFPVSCVNEEPRDGELAIYTNATNKLINNAGKYVIRTSESIVTKRPISGQSYRMTTGSVVDNKTFSLNGGEFAIVVKGENKLSQFMYNCIQYGTQVSIISAPAGTYNNMQYVVGGWDILVKDGVVQTSTHSTASDPNGGGQDAPRTIIGAKEDGTIFLAVLDGRQSSWSVGCTVQEEADLAKTLGAKYALELDGGGSSTFLYDKGNGLVKLNKPSDGSDRAVYNAVLLVEKSDSDMFYTLDDYTLPGEQPPASSNNSAADSTIDSTLDSVAGNSGCGGVVSGVGVLVAGCFICATAIMKKRNY